MTLDTQTVIGLLASGLTTIALLPQLLKVAKEKKSGDVSVIMLITLFAGLAAWVYYGILKKDLIIIISNAISLVINAVSTALVIKFK